jgi:hypothetical protein
MGKAYALSQSDRDVLAALVQDYLTTLPEPSRVRDEQDDYRTHGALIAYPQTADGIAAMTGTTPGSATCTIYQLSGGTTPTIVGFQDNEKVYNISLSPIGQDYFIVHRLKTGGYVAASIPRVGSTGVFLAEDHPGRGIVFDVYVGTWNSATHDWEYVGTATYKAIDWRYGVPYPTQGAQGLAEWRSSDSYGDILEITSLDCEAPGTGTSA